jgi:arylsulfatase A
VRFDNWKAVRNQGNAPLELYDLATDLGEEHNLAAKHPDVVVRVEKILAESRTKSDYLPIDGGRGE